MDLCQKNRKQRVYIACDPGINGAYAVLDSNNKVLELDHFPTFKTGVKNQREIDGKILFEKLEKYKIKEFILEKVHAMPLQGRTGIFGLGVSLGILKGIGYSLGKKPILVTPQKWKKHFGLIGKPKDSARLLAQTLFPSALLSRKKDVDKADALLMALWYLETYVNVNK